MSHGGTNKFIYDFVTSLKNEAEISIFPINPDGAYNSLFPKGSVIKSNNKLSVYVGSRSVGKVQSFIERISMRLCKNARECAHNSAAKMLSPMGFDVVIAAQEGRSCSLGAMVKSKKHIAWIHCDYSNYIKSFGGGTEEDVKGLGQMDSIVCVSEYTAKVLREIYPHLSKKIFAVHNLINCESIIEKSKQKPNDDRFTTGKFTIVSVGRFDKVKRFDIIPSVAYGLKEKGADFYWYIIGGGGNQEQNIRNEISEKGMVDYVVLLGLKDNPYPFLANSNLLVCTSVSEACPYVINEARILHIPVITTNFGSAGEYIKHGFNGLISTEEKLESDILEMISNSEKIKENIKEFVYENCEIKEKILHLLDIL